MSESALKSYVLSVVDAYRAATNAGDKWISNKFFGDHRVIERLRQRRGRGSITLRKLFEGLQALSNGWPQGLPWPAVEIRLKRPAPRKGAKPVHPRRRR